MSVLKISALFSLVLSIGCLGPDGQQKHAREYVQALLNGDADTMHALSRQSTRAAMNANAIAELNEALVLRHGLWTSIGTPTQERAVLKTTVFIPVHFEREEVEFAVIFDRSKKVADLHFRTIPGTQKAPVAHALPPQVQQIPWQTEHSPKYPVKGTLTLPKTTAHAPASLPIVILVPDAGAQDRDQRIGELAPFRDIAWHLAEHGIASLRFDKRTWAYRDSLDPDSLTLETELTDDLVAAIRWVLHTKAYAFNAWHVLSHGWGCTVVPTAIGRVMAQTETTALKPSPASWILAAPTFKHLADILSDDALRQETDLRKRKRILLQREQLRGDLTDMQGRLLGLPASYWRSLENNRFQERMTQLLTSHAIKTVLIKVESDRFWLPKRDDGFIASLPNIIIRNHPATNRLLLSQHHSSKSPERANRVSIMILEDVTQSLLATR